MTMVTPQDERNVAACFIIQEPLFYHFYNIYRSATEDGPDVQHCN